MRLSLLVLILAAITIVAPGCGPSLRETGVPTDGTVISKRSTGMGTKKKYFITVNFFTQPDKENPKPEKPKDTNRTVDEIINDLTIDVNFGDYQTAEMQVTSGEFDKYNEGDEVKIRYEKGNPSNAVLDQ